MFLAVRREIGYTGSLSPCARDPDAQLRNDLSWLQGQAYVQFGTNTVSRASIVYVQRARAQNGKAINPR